MDKKTFLKYYLKQYHATIQNGSDKKKNEANKVKRLIHKLQNHEIYHALPFDRISTEEQGELVFHLLEQVSDREIIANMVKNDINRDFTAFNMPLPEKWTNQQTGPDMYTMKMVNRALIRHPLFDSQSVLSALKKQNEDLRNFCRNEFSLKNFEDYLSYVTDRII